MKEEKRIKPYVIWKKVVQPSEGETVIPLIQDKVSIESATRDEGADGTMKQGTANKDIVHKGGIVVMKMQELRKIAATWGVDVRAVRSRRDIIRDIQIREGYSPCFETRETCDNDCMWKDDCLGKK